MDRYRTLGRPTRRLYFMILRAISLTGLVVWVAASSELPSLGLVPTILQGWHSPGILLSETRTIFNNDHQGAQVTQGLPNRGVRFYLRLRGGARGRVGGFEEVHQDSRLIQMEQ